MSTDAEFPFADDETGMEPMLDENAFPGTLHPPAYERFQALLSLLGAPTELVPRLLGGVPLEVGPLDITWRGTGLTRPGTIVQLAWPRLDTRIGVSIENTISHVIVDHLLGFSRLPAEAARQVTPVEFGVLTFVAARALDRLDARPGPWGTWDLTIERIGPDAFNPSGLGPIVTVRLPISLGEIKGAIRLWLPEALINQAEIETSPGAVASRENVTVVDSTWRAEGGIVTLSRGLARLKIGAVLPLDQGSITGSISAPSGPAQLVCDSDDGLSRIDVQPVPDTAFARVCIGSQVRKEPVSRTKNPPPAAPDSPVKLVVELGRVNLPPTRLANLKIGEIIELIQHENEPVELTLNGKLLARGQLVQIDTELGVRVKTVFT